MNENVKTKANRIEIYHDNFQNYKRYNIPKAQLVIADIPYNIGTDFYASNPNWYVGGDNKNGESDKAKKLRSTVILSLILLNTFTFAVLYLKKSLIKVMVGGSQVMLLV